MVRVNFLRAILLALTLLGAVRVAARRVESVALRLPAGLAAEMVVAAGPANGLWTRLAVTPGGEFFVVARTNSAPDSGVLLWIRRSANGSPFQAEPVQSSVRELVDLVTAPDGLWVVGVGPEGLGPYRLNDADHDGQFETATRARLPDEVVPEAMVAGPDGDLFVLTKSDIPSEGLTTNEPDSLSRQDTLPCLRDVFVVNAARGKLGTIWRGDPTGQRWQRFAGAVPLPSSLVTSADGELWLVTADTSLSPFPRLLHVRSGTDFGVKWKEADAPMDRPPSALAVGTASEMFLGARRNPLLLVAPGSGRLTLAALEPAGGGFTAKAADFAAEGPIIWQDVRSSADGAFYGLAAGAEGGSTLFRLRWADNTNNPAAGVVNLLPPLRRQLEALHFRPEPGRLDFVWANLAHRDGHIRFAASVALAHLDVQAWRDRAFNERRPSLAFPALAALVRVKGAPPAEIQNRLLHFLPEALDQRQTLNWLRVFELSFVRHGRPEAGLRDRILARLESIYPFEELAVDRPLSRQLSWLGSTNVVAKTLRQLSQIPNSEEQFALLTSLNMAAAPPPADERRRLVEWIGTKIASQDVLTEQWKRLAELLGMPPAESAPPAP